MSAAPLSAERHPKGLYVLFFTEMWERFGFYSMLAMFVKYLTDDKYGGLGWAREQATTLYAIYLASVYFTPLLGGFIADKKLGYRNSVLLGGVIFMTGYFLMAVRNETVVYISLLCLVVGNGFFKPNVSAMVGHLYPEGSKLKDRAYNIFYMGINIGALLAPINAEIMVRYVGYNLAFATAGVGMIISVVILWVFRIHISERQEIASPATTTAAPAQPIDAVPDSRRIGALLAIFVVAVVFWMVFHQNGSTLTYWADNNTDWKVSGIISNAINPFWVVTLSIPVVWLWQWLASQNREPSIPAKMSMGMGLCAASFLLLYFAARSGESTPVTSEMYAKGDYSLVQRSLNKLREEGVPQEVLTALERKDDNKKYVLLGKTFVTEEKQPTGEEKLKAALGKELTSGQLEQYGTAIRNQSYLFKVSPLWLIVAYAIMTLGELMFSPMGLSLVSKVAPIRLRGLMMGGWFVATSIGNALTIIGVYWDVWMQSTFFIVLTGVALLMGLALALLLRPLNKAMPV